MPSPTDIPPVVLLVEEYGALAVAISSALKKFAPGHRIEVVRTLADAERAAREQRLELFILDFDPPLCGELPFLENAKQKFPEARMLVIAAGTARAIAAERGTSGAIQFIEKPFELAEFGAAVQALLGPWAKPASEKSRGTLRDLQILDVLQMKCLSGESIVVRVEAKRGQSGQVHFHRGQIVHAATGRLRGVDALERMVGWRHGRFTESERPSDGPKTIDIPWEALLLDALLRTEETMPAAAVEKPAAAPRAPTKKILAIDDTEMLLIFAADVLTDSEAGWEIVTAATGHEGLNLAATIRPDLILADYSLPDLDGGRVCERLLSDPVTARIPVLMMSGHVPEMEKAARQHRNIIATLAKPFLSEQLIGAVKAALAAGPLSEKKLDPAPSGAAPVSMPEWTAPPVRAVSNGKTLGPAQPAIAAVAIEEEIVATPEPTFVVLPDPVVVPRSSASLIAPARSGAIAIRISFDVASLRLTPAFTVGTMDLSIASSAVSLGVGSDGTHLIDARFELGVAALNGEGGIETLQIIPAQPPPQKPAEVKTATSAAALRVDVEADYEVTAVELSPTFEIASVVVKPRNIEVRVQAKSTDGDSREDAAPVFDIAEVQLDDAARLCRLRVKPRSPH